MLVALQAPAHRLIDDASNSVHVLHVPVACLARNARVDVRNVIEENAGRARESVNAFPFGFCLRLRVFQYLLNLRIVAFDFLVTQRTLFGAGDQHVRRSSFTVLVTKLTLDLVLSNMNPVTIFNRLHWRIDRASRSGENNRCHNRDDDYSSQNEPSATQDNSLLFSDFACRDKARGLGR
jgi:hypothetical protein